MGDARRWFPTYRNVKGPERRTDAAKVAHRDRAGIGALRWRCRFRLRPKPRRGMLAGPVLRRLDRAEHPRRWAVGEQSRLAVSRWSRGRLVQRGESQYEVACFQVLQPTHPSTATTLEPRGISGSPSAPNKAWGAGLPDR